MSRNPRVLYVGDSSKMKGGVAEVIKALVGTWLWEKYGCRWLECQINDAKWKKWAYLFRALFKGLVMIPSADIIHFHSAVGNSLRVQFPFLLYSLLWRKKVIVHFHVGNQLADASSDRLFIFYCRHADRVITLSDALRSYIPGYREHPETVEFLYNPAPAIREKTGHSPYFLMAAYFTPDRNKGCDTVLKAMAALHREQPEWRLVLCGSGDMEGLDELIRENGLTEVVDTPGWVTGKEKEDYFSDAYAYVLASRKEGLPISILEAMSAGLPVITTPVGSIPEILEDRSNALFFPPGDDRALLEAMRLLIEDPSLGERMAASAQNTVREKLSLDRFVGKLDTLYRAVQAKSDDV